MAAASASSTRWLRGMIHGFDAAHARGARPAGAAPPAVVLAAQRARQRSSQASSAAGVGEQRAQGRVVAAGRVGQAPPGEREVDAVLRAAAPASRRPARASAASSVVARRRPSLARWPCSSAAAYSAGNASMTSVTCATACLTAASSSAVGHQRQQRLGEARQVPARDRRLVAVGVAAAVVDGAEDRGRVVGLHEGAGAVVDRLARDRHVVGVHHAVDEADVHPLRDQRRLARGHRAQQRQVAVRRAGQRRVVARDACSRPAGAACRARRARRRTGRCPRAGGWRRRASAPRRAARASR